MNLKSVGVIGAGQMGSGIAQVFAMAGFQVVLNDVRQKQLDQAMGLIERNIERQVAKGKTTPGEKSAALDLIKPALDLEFVGQCDLVIEAATERETVKQAIFVALAPPSGPSYDFDLEHFVHFDNSAGRAHRSARKIHGLSLYEPRACHATGRAYSRHSHR